MNKDSTRFTFGKFKGQLIKNCCSEWHLELIADKYQNIAAIERLKELGYTLYNGSWKNQDQIKAIEQKDIRVKEALESMSFTYIPQRNIKSYRIDKITGILMTDEYGDILFESIPLRQNSYKGFDFMLPVLSGTAKRIKNRKVVFFCKDHLSENGDLIVTDLHIESEKEFRLKRLVQMI